MSPSVSLDRLSALLEGLAPHISVRHAGGVATPSSFAPEEADFVRLHLIIDGRAQLQLADGKKHCLAAPAIAILRADCGHVLIPCEDEPAPSFMCIDACFEGPVGTMFLETFAEPLLVPLDEPEADLGLVIRLIAYEMAQPRCGRPALLTRAGDILFIGVLRHLIAHPRTSFGLLNGLADQRIARALVAMHAAPQMPWTLDSLALEAGMSRTAFAILFRDSMNRTPGSYLAQLRLSIARRVVSRGLGLKRAAKESGYASTTALSRALSRPAITANS